jgi:hypothetical protein
MVCDFCSGRGWVRARRVPAVHCTLCGGKGELSWGQVSRLLKEDPTTLARVREGRSRIKTCRRVLDKVMRLLYPKGQTELLSG